MNVQYLTDDKGKKKGVLVSMKEWGEILKKINTAQFYEDFRESVREIKMHNEGKTNLKDARELLNEL